MLIQKKPETASLTIHNIFVLWSKYNASGQNCPINGIYSFKIKQLIEGDAANSTLSQFYPHSNRTIYMHLCIINERYIRKLSRISTIVFERSYFYASLLCNIRSNDPMLINTDPMAFNCEIVNNASHAT